MIGDLIRTPPVSCQATCSQLPGRTFICAPCPIGQSQSSGASVECTSCVGHRRPKLRRLGIPPKWWFGCAESSPQTSETFRSRKCLENLPRVMIRIIKTKIFGCQTKAKGAMFFFSVVFGPWFSLGAFL